MYYYGNYMMWSLILLVVVNVCLTTDVITAASELAIRLTISKSTEPCPVAECYLIGGIPWYYGDPTTPVF